MSKIKSQMHRHMQHKIEFLTLDELEPYAKNSRVHSEEQVDQIVDSIHEFGFTNPILIDGQNGIIAGHGRFEAATRMGIEKVPCVRLDHLTEAQKRAYVIADNKLALNATWDDSILSEELMLLKEDEFDLDVVGFSDEELADLLPPEVEEKKSEGDDDTVPELVDENPYGVKLGDIWQLGNHRVMCADSTIKENVDKLMDGEKADMVFTDPPYGINLDTDYSNIKASNHVDFPRIAKKHKQVLNDDIPYDPSFLLKIFEYVDELFLWGFDYYMDKLPVGCPIVWDKTGGNDSLMQAGFGANFELCWSKTSHKRDLIRYTYKGVAGMRPEDGNRVHPTQKPVGLACYFFDKWGKDKTNIVDLFLGSGSTLIACEKTNRTCFGCELDPHYVSVIINRWEQFTGNKAKRIVEGKG